MSCLISIVHVLLFVNFKYAAILPITRFMSVGDKFSELKQIMFINPAFFHRGIGASLISLILNLI